MKFHVDEKSTVTIASLPWKDSPAFVFQIDTTGELIHGTLPGHLAITPNFNSEVINSRNCPDVFDISLYCMDPPRVDSLYHYDAKKNRLLPVFTFNMTTTDPVPWHGYSEWPDYFVGDFSGPPVIKMTDFGYSMMPGETFHYIVDKSTGKGAYLKIYNDYFGNLVMDNPSYLFDNGYHIENVEPGNLLESIEKALKDETLSTEKRQQLTDLKAGIDENDNNYVLIYKLKKKSK